MQQKEDSHTKMLQKLRTSELEEKDYIRMMDEKDEKIRKLELKIIKLERDVEELMKGATGSANTFYKEKLEQEIQDNEIATELLITMTMRMQKLIELLRLSPEKCEDSTEVKNILKIMGESFDPEFDMDDSEIQNIDAVQSQVLKKMEALEEVCDVYHKNHKKLEKEYQSVENDLKESKKQGQEETRLHQRELRQLQSSAKELKRLQEQSEESKKQLMKSIANSLDPKNRKQLESLTKEQLIEYIKKQMYRMNELENSKKEAMIQNKRIKTVELEKYKKILNEVKEVKECNRLAQSFN